MVPAMRHRVGTKTHDGTVQRPHRRLVRSKRQLEVGIEEYQPPTQCTTSRALGVDRVCSQSTRTAAGAPGRSQAQGHVNRKLFATASRPDRGRGPPGAQWQPGSAAAPAARKGLSSLSAAGRDRIAHLPLRNNFAVFNGTVLRGRETADRHKTHRKHY